MKTLTLNTPHNLLMAATFFANKGYREGKCISHSQVIEEIKQLKFRKLQLAQFLVVGFGFWVVGWLAFLMEDFSRGESN